jgi:7tm Odorant receptor
MVLLSNTAVQLFKKISIDRQYIKQRRQFWYLIEKYTKVEWMALKLLYASIISQIFILNFCVLTFDVNETKFLFIDFCVTFTDCEKLSLVWFINFFYQQVMALVAMFMFFAHFGTVFMLLSHACFKVDTVIVTVKKLGRLCEHSKMNLKYWRIYNHELIERRIRKILAESCDARHFIGMAQTYIATTILAETVILCLIVCMSLFSITKSHANLPICYVSISCSILQLFVYNFIGQRLQSKLEELIEAVYNLHWYNMHPKVILMSLQRFRGFHGIFFYLSHETFYQVR